MFKTIMVPVDLTHLDKLARALAVASDLAKLYGSAIHYVGVTGNTPGVAAHTPQEYTEKLNALAAARGQADGVDIKARAVVSHDPAVELDGALRNAAEELGCDLIVMASHVPGFAQHLFSSHGGYLASHATISVFLVR